MIGKISGVLDYRANDHVLVDVRGVGYVVYVSDRTLASLPGAGAAVALYTELVVREDLLQLYGFTTLREKEWHRLLVSVQGVGAKAALAILGTLGVDATARAITIGDWAAIKAAPGVGPKIAQRVVLELKNKAPAVMAMGGVAQSAAPEMDVIDAGDLDAPRPAAPKPAKQASPTPSAAAAQAEALSALQNLGYAPQDAATAVVTAMDAAPDLGESTPNLIRAALKLLAPKN